MLKYNGKIFFDNPLNNKEIEFLQNWQAKLVEINNEYRQAGTKQSKETISEKINTYSGIDFDDKQRWAIFFAMSPMIYFHKDCIELKGQSPKGNMREALMAYHHFFIGNDAVLKECMDLNFLKTHNFSGIVESWKKDKYGDESQWCYLAQNNKISSIDAPTIKDYYENPDKWTKIEKEDTFYDKLVMYFPPLMNYASLKKSINQKNSEKPVEKTQRKMKV